MRIKIVVAATVLFMLQQVKISAQLTDLDGGPMGIERVAMCVGSPIPYISTPPKDSLLPNWVQIDLGAVFSVEAVKLYPYFKNQNWSGAFSHNFPIRFRTRGGTFSSAEVTSDIKVRNEGDNHIIGANGWTSNSAGREIYEK
jgi:hypothetical protein